MKKINGVYKWILFYVNFCFVHIHLYKEKITSITEYKKINTHIHTYTFEERKRKTTVKYMLEQQIFKQT